MSKKQRRAAKQAQGGEILSSQTVGEFNRYRIDEFRTRFGSIVFMVADAERLDELTGLPSIVRQAATREAAVAGLR